MAFDLADKNEAKKILAIYAKTGSIKSTAKVTGMSEGKVRKLLISADAFVSERYAQVFQLFKSGMTSAQIARELKISTRTVNTYLPYTKAVYNCEIKSKNAERIARHRLSKTKE